jgi:hypothetical protein
MPEDKVVVNIVWAETINDKELKNLKEQVEHALKDPDYTIIANYEIHWERIAIDKNAVARIVWSDEISFDDVKILKEEVNKALSDPDHVIVANYPVHWTEISK